MLKLMAFAGLAYLLVGCWKCNEAEPRCDGEALWGVLGWPFYTPGGTGHGTTDQDGRHGN